ncbi:hypothetical protein BDW02DRAFT_593774 [Decorospora gaudefroyi]|uniref:DUF3176 domain-containing protein n=1 Tax=Decorospora gaudefroyi TaxID=184978 RepID=A0A6A5KT40_9PLEO|nr:hypothetical protein BDW02DRAFT_593774 [Decorospora gaudefroyi]
MNNQNDRLLPSSFSGAPHAAWARGPGSGTPPQQRIPHEGYKAAGHYHPLISGEPVSPVYEDSIPKQTGTVNAIPLSSMRGLSGSYDSESKATSELPPARSRITSWMFEILALIASVASTVAIVAILIHQNGKPLADWTFRFTVNTVIATLGTVARTTLAFALSACIGQQKWNWLSRKPDTVRAFERFDEASRGPWGGTRLFIWLRFRHWAALGALVTVGTVAFDPFLQAIISTYGQSDDVTTTSSATIGQALKADGGYIINYKSGPVGLVSEPFGNYTYTATTSVPDFGIISSIYGGFHNTSGTYDKTVAFECMTGNCTWPVFVSAAVCSSCVDVSGELTSATKEGSRNGTNVPGPTNVLSSRNYTTFSLPQSEIKNWNGVSRIKGPNPDWYEYSGVSASPRTLMTISTLSRARRTLKFPDVQTLMIGFSVIKASDDYIDSKVPWELSRPVATECVMYLCSNAYQASSEAGVLKEDVMGSWAIRDRASHQGIDSKYSGFERWIEEDETSSYDLYSPGIDFPRNDLRLVVPPEQSKSFPTTMAREVNISHALLRSTIDYLRDFAGGGKLVAFPDRDSPPFVDAIWNSTNLTTTFDNVAKSLTNQIRNSSPQRQEGAAQRWVIHLHVKWAYLAYPVTMLAFGILYVVLIMIESTRLRLPAWKESALPTLMYGFDEATQRLLRRNQGYNGGKKEDTRVRFGSDGQDSTVRLLAA